LPNLPWSAQQGDALPRAIMVIFDLGFEDIRSGHASLDREAARCREMSSRR